MADGTDFQIGIGVTGAADANSAAAAVAALADRLTSAGAASDAASAAMKAGQIAYNQAETTADRAAKALERIGIAAEAQKGKAAAVAEEFGLFSPQFQKASDKLAALTSRQSEAASKAASTAAAVAAEAASLDKLKTAASTAADNETKLSKAHTDATAAAKTAAKATKDTGDEAKGSSVNLRALSGAFGKLGGPLGGIGQTISGVGGAFQKFSKLLGDSGPYVAAGVAIAAIAAAAAVAAVALISATIAVGSWAVGLADAARTSALLSAGIARSVAGGVLLDNQLDDLTSKVPIAREELASMAKGLADGGLRGKDLAAALDKAATKAATLKFGPDFSRQMLSLGNQSIRLKTNIAGIFGGLEIEGLLEGFSKLVALFDSTSVTGKAIKVVFESLFQPLIDGVTRFIPKMVTAFIQFEILVLKALIAIKPFGDKILFVAECFGILAVIVTAMAVGFTIAIIAPFAIIAGLAVVVIAGIISLGEALLGVASSALAFGQGIKGSVGGALDWLANLSLVSIGTNMMQGLIDGITGSAAAVLASIKGVVSGAVDAAKKTLGIASPSKVFAEIGEFTGAGMAQGVDKSSDDVQGSLESMVAPPAAPAAAGASAGSSSSGIVIQNLTIQSATDDPKGFADAFLGELERLSAQSGSAVPRAA